MPLAPQVIPVVLGQRDGSKSPKLSVPGSLVTLENMVQVQQDRYEKRPGSLRLGSLASGSGQRLAAMRSGAELIATDDVNLFAFTDSDDAQAFVSRGSIESYLPRVRDLGLRGHQADVAVVGGKVFYVYARTAGAPNVAANTTIRYSVFEQATGRALVVDALIATWDDTVSDPAPCPRAVVAGRHVAFLYGLRDPGTGGSSLFARAVHANAPSSLTSQVEVTTDMGASRLVAFDAYGRGGLVDVFYGSADGNLRLRRFDPRANVVAGDGAAVSTGVSGMVAAIPHDGSDGKLYCAVGGTSGADGVVRVYRFSAVESATGQAPGIFSTALIRVGVANAFRTACGWFDAATGGLGIVAESWDPGTAKHLARIEKVTITAAGAATTATLIRSLGLASRTWQFGSSRYVVASYATASAQQKYFVLNVTSPGIMARFLDGTGGGMEAHGGPRTALPNVYTADSGENVLVPLVRNTPDRYLIAASLSRAMTGVAVGNAKEAADVTVIPGGVVRTFDGYQLGEIAPHVFPEPPTLTPSSADGSGTFAADDYLICTVFKFVDTRTGRITYSGPSAAVSVTAASTGSVSVSQPSYRTTARTTAKPVIEVYMTGASPGTNPAFYFHNSALNDETSDTVTILVTTPNITERELYVLSDESVLENVPAPSFKAIEVFGGRVFGISGEDPVSLWPSKLIQEGEGVVFNDESLPMRVEDDAGDLTALAAVEDKLILFKKNAIYAIWGEGPDNTGNGAFSAPFRLAGNLGTDSPIVFKTELGVIFRASDDSGFWIIDRNLAPAFLGLPVQDISGLTLTDIVAVPKKRQIRITSEEGTTLVYDLAWKRWYVFTDQKTRGACVYNGAYHYIDALGVVRYEDPNTWHDDGVPVKYAWETSWISFAGLAGWGRTWAIQIIGDYLGKHRQLIRAFYDFGAHENAWKWDGVAAHTDEYGDGGLYGAQTSYGGNIATGAMAPDGRLHLECRVPLKFQSHTAIKLRGEEYFPDGELSAGFALEALAFAVGIGPGRKRLPPGYKATSLG